MPNDVPEERTFTGGINDYFVADNATTNFSFYLEAEKTLADTSESSTTGLNVAVGERLTYKIVVDVPDDAAFSGVTLVDTLDTGLVYVSSDSVIASGSMSTSLGSFGLVTPIVSGQSITWNLGTIDNSDINDNTQESIVIRYDTRVANITGVQNGTNLVNGVILDWNGGTGTSVAATVNVVEPVVTIAKSVS